MTTFPDPQARRHISGELAALGPFFAADIHRCGEGPNPPWRSVREIVDAPGVLDERVSRVRAALAGGRPADSVELRVAASAAQLGLVARLIAPTIAIAALEFRRVVIASNDWWWQDRLGGPFPLSITLREHHSPVNPIRGVIDHVTITTAAAYGVPLRTVWGNTASATNSAAQMITRSRPDAGPRARAAADSILADSRIEEGALHSGPAFRRTSCCLIYRLNPSSLCGDCVLHRSPNQPHRTRTSDQDDGHSGGSSSGVRQRPRGGGPDE